MSGPWRVPAHSHGLLSCGALVWTHRGAAILTVVAKASHSLTPPFAPASPEPLLAEDRHDGADPKGLVRAPSDVIPRLPRAEVLHVGRVVAPAGVTMVRLALFRGDKPLVDKRKLAQRADPSSGLGPISRSSAERAALRAGADAPALDAAGVLVVPDGVDLAFEQAAPADQRCDELAAGDRLLLGNLHPTIAELVIPLPLAPPSGRALAGGNVAALAFSCRRVLVDTDAGRLTTTWLATLPLSGVRAADHLRVEVAAAAAAPGAPAAGVDARGLLARAVTGAAAKAPAPTAVTVGTMILEDAAAPAGAGAPPGTGTMVLGDAAAPARAPAVPFARGAKAEAPPRKDAAASATPWAKADRDRPKAAPAAAAAGAGTMILEDEPSAPRLPPPPAPPPPAPPPGLPLPGPPPPAPSPPTEAVAAASASPGAEAPPEREPKPAPQPEPAPAPPKPKTREEVWARPEAAEPPPAPLPKPKPEPRVNALHMLYRKGK